MKINSKVLSLPPYISTSWKNIVSMHMEKSSLALVLQNGTKIEIPSLEKSIIELIFSSHAKFLEEQSSSLENISSGIDFPMKIGFGMDSFPIMQHNPQQADAPDLPPETLQKIASVARIFGIDEGQTLPNPEPHCNCIYCQIAKALQNQEETPQEEEVSDEELQFRLWDIKQTSEKLYLVANPLDSEEQYSVFLGDPIGCTCGKKNCEHIQAVLKS